MPVKMSLPLDGSVREDVLTAAEQNNLGLHRTTVGPRRQSVAVLIPAFIVNFAVGIGLTFLCGIGLIYIAWNVWALMHKPQVSKRQAARRLHFFEHGLIVAGHEGPTAVVRWDSVSVYQYIVRVSYSGVRAAARTHTRLCSQTGSRSS